MMSWAQRNRLCFGSDRAVRRSCAAVGCAAALLVLSAVLVPARALAQVPPPLDPLSFEGPDPTAQFKDIKIEQRLDAQVPLELRFKDEHGEEVQFEDFLGDRPAILSLVWYDCPMLCPMILNDLGIVLKAIKYDVGEDFDVITVSIDPGETPELAAEMKATHLEALGRAGAEEGWHFLTGEKEAIDVLADTVGFRYAYDPNSDQYAHAAGIMVLTPRGKVSRYFYGLNYIPRDVEFGLTEASEGKIGNLVDQLVLLCFAYDPATGKYGFYILGAMRIGAVLTVLGLLLFWLTHYLKTRARALTETGPDAPGRASERASDTDPDSMK